MIKNYVMLTKPGIIMGNAMTAIGGFILASQGNINVHHFLAVLTGLSLIIGSACVFNNYIDRQMDQKMSRTQHRALARGVISVRSAMIFAGALISVGMVVLALASNWLAVAIALTGFFIYVIFYSFGKYRTSYSTLIGSVAGAVPPVVGYCAASQRFDMGAFILFLIVALWQMPHFFAIALYRLEDYAAASIPVLPLKKGNQVTKMHMLFYIIAFMLASLSLTVFGYTGYLYLAVASGLGIGWLWMCIKGFKSSNDKLWARKMFIFSLVVITVLCLMISWDFQLNLKRM